VVEHLVLLQLTHIVGSWSDHLPLEVIRGSAILGIQVQSLRVACPDTNANDGTDTKAAIDATAAPGLVLIIIIVFVATILVLRPDRRLKVTHVHAHSSSVGRIFWRWRWILISDLVSEGAHQISAWTSSIVEDRLSHLVGLRHYWMVWIERLGHGLLRLVLVILRLYLGEAWTHLLLLGIEMRLRLFR